MNSSKATISQVASSLRATIRKNPKASTCATLRALAKALPKVSRGDFISGVSMVKPKMSDGTISRQFYEGRA